MVRDEFEEWWWVAKYTHTWQRHSFQLYSKRGRWFGKNRGAGILIGLQLKPSNLSTTTCRRTKFPLLFKPVSVICNWKQLSFLPDKIKVKSSPNVVFRIAPPCNLLEKQILGPRPRSTISLGRNPGIFNKPSRWLLCMQKFENHCSPGRPLICIANKPQVLPSGPEGRPAFELHPCRAFCSLSGRWGQQCRALTDAH